MGSGAYSLQCVYSFDYLLTLAVGRWNVKAALCSPHTGCRSTVWTLLTLSASQWSLDFFHISLHLYAYSSMKEWSIWMYIVCIYLIWFFTFDAGVGIGSVFCDIMHLLCDGTQSCLIWVYYKVYCIWSCTKPSNHMRGLLFNQEVNNVWTQTTMRHHFIQLMLI